MALHHVCYGAGIGLLAAAAISCASIEKEKAKLEPTAGEIETVEAGKKLQDTTPVDQLGIYLIGFHPLKEEPEHQMTAHHYCHQVNENFAQCALFDGNGKTAKLNGIEYIISEKIYEALPEDEKKYWHPHNYEILSGQLVAPGLPEDVEHEAMKQKMNSYGKTWHVWNTGGAGMAADMLPLGDPVLGWSFNRDGEAAPGVVEERDRAVGIDSRKKKEARRDLLPLAKPQGGVDALKGKFDRQTTEIEGVVDIEAVAE